MERKRRVKLVNGLSRVQGGELQARGRKDTIPRITLSSDLTFPAVFEGGDSRMMIGFSFFRRRSPAEV